MTVDTAGTYGEVTMCAAVRAGRYGEAVTLDIGTVEEEERLVTNTKSFCTHLLARASKRLRQQAVSTAQDSRCLLESVTL